MWLDNENTYFVNDLFSTCELIWKPHFMFSSMNLKVPQCLSFGVYHNNAPLEQFIQRCQNTSNYIYMARSNMSINREIFTPWIHNQALNEVLANISHIIVDTCNNIRIIWQWQNSNIVIQVLWDPHLWPTYTIIGSCCPCFLPFIINPISNPMEKNYGQIRIFWSAIGI